MLMKVNAVFISDVHLGTKGSKTKKLLDFLDEVEPNVLYLVGDIIDGWAMERNNRWTKEHTHVIRKILKISEKIKVIYLAGNHDEFVRPFLKNKFDFGNIQVADRVFHEAIDGRKIFVTHGDKFDFWMKVPKWLINIGARITDFFGITDIVSHSRDMGKSKQRYLRTISTQSTIEKYIKLKKIDAAICGHTHIPKIEGPYMNCGDWVKNCTSLVEHTDGTWELLEKK